MRLIEIRRVPSISSNGTPIDYICVSFVQNTGIPAQFVLDVPDPFPVNWREWAEQRILEHLLETEYGEPFETLWPDRTRAVTSKLAVEQMQGWATWTADEAAAWIEANVTSFADAVTTLAKLARVFVYLRDIVIEQ